MPEFNFNSDQTLDKVIKSRMKEDFRLIENPTLEQIEEIVNKRKRGKIVYFKNFIDKIGDNLDDIIDTGIVQKSIKVKVKN